MRNLTTLHCLSGDMLGEVIVSLRGGVHVLALLQCSRFERDVWAGRPTVRARWLWAEEMHRITHKDSAAVVAVSAVPHAVTSALSRALRSQSLELLQALVDVAACQVGWRGKKGGGIAACRVVKRVKQGGDHGTCAGGWIITAQEI